MSDPSVEALRAYLATNKENEMPATDIPTPDTHTVSLTTEEYNRQLENAKRVAEETALRTYKEKLAELIEKYAYDHNLCDEGVQSFCEEAGIDLARTYSGTLILTVEVGARSEERAYEDMSSLLSEVTNHLQHVLDIKVHSRHNEVQDVTRES